ncbi:hypothetical protein, partial [Mesotoga sp. Brook.08.105.5.1]|uniref:hypothetical protein n=1 Tax=Mesotoga sp. Brook.08.105.5.1 TaxID=1421002 RepID=UPI001A9C7D0F
MFKRVVVGSQYVDFDQEHPRNCSESLRFLPRIAIGKMKKNKPLNQRARFIAIIAKAIMVSLVSFTFPRISPSP